MKHLELTSSNTIQNNKTGDSVLTLQVPQQREVHAPGFDEFIEMYISLKSETLTPASIATYQSALRGFLEWWRNNAEDYNHVLTRKMFNDFFEWYMTEFYSAKTGVGATLYMRRETAAVLRRILRYAHQSGALTEDVSNMVDTIQYEQAPPYFPSLDEIYAIITAPDDTLRMRDTALMAIMASTGCRREEACEVRIENVHFFDTDVNDLDASKDHSGWILFNQTKRRVAYLERARASIFDTVGGLLIKLWLAWSGRKKGRIVKVSPMALYNRVIKHAKAAGVPQVHPHSFRHAFNDLWLTDNAQYGDVADLARRMQLGHTFDKTDVNLYHYANWKFNPKQPERTIERIRPYHTSPLKKLATLGRWDWSIYPVIQPFDQINQIVNSDG